MSPFAVVQLRRVVRLKSGDFITAEEIEDEGLYPVYGGNGTRGFTERWNTEGPIVLIGRQGAHCGNVQIAPGKCWVSEHALRCIPEKPINLSYFRYALQSLSLGQYSVSSAQPGLSTDNLKPILIPSPSLKTQGRIALFLDAKTAQIDALIAKKQSLLERFAEKRQAIITRAVTKGLTPSVPMKESGIEWLGKVPAHWKVKRLCFLGRSQNGLNIGGEFFGSGYPFVSYSDVYNNYSLPQKVAGLVESSAEDRKRYSVKRGDIFFTRTSETVEEIGFSSVCLESIEDACFAGFLIRVRPWADMLLPEFSQYYFRQIGLRAFLVKEMNLVTRASLSQTLLGSLPVLLPPLAEQKEIACQTASTMSQIDAIASHCSTSINQLSEYRSALITAAVTGQIEGLR